ncbi:carbohydrate ABC transporter permease [Nocardiopsis lambiniae]|uniref:Carbohydrate ABC transporter permease n=1 Tax=Nocardiopsis lambiniae TaxID=3075539 RepID=A0ABU2MBT2_9ACTN|nr:carbohydrate ABC transporter permease [Nocardiopsis sp. DSM 44743]MDT0330128.1 carbohydrate ABC transporter permease [Nocardiopsis sp. DSM 44743]
MSVVQERAPVNTPGGTRPPRPGTARTRRRGVGERPNVLGGLGALIWLLVVAVPLYALLIATVQRGENYVPEGPLAPPSDPTLGNYATAVEKGLLGFVWNTALVTVAVVILVVVLAATTSFAIVRSRRRLTDAAFRMFLLGLAIPSQAVIIPVYLIIVRLGLYDSLTAIVLPTAAFALPVCVLILVGSMRDISEELYEAMALDGAGSVRAFLWLVVPMSRSGLSTVAVYSALQAWNGFLFPLILTQSADKRLITMGLFEFQGEYRVDVPGLLTAVVLSTVPLFIIYLVARRSLADGLMGVGGK